MLTGSNVELRGEVGTYSYSANAPSKHYRFVVTPKLRFVASGRRFDKKSSEIATETRSTEFIIVCCTANRCFEHYAEARSDVAWVTDSRKLPWLLKLGYQEIRDGEANKA